MIETQLPHFDPALWLPNAHFQTVYASLLMRVSLPDYQREIIELPDGDIIAADWIKGDAQKPLLVLIHGMEGSSDSNYARLLMNECRRSGWRGVVLHMRSCGGLINRHRIFYHAGFYRDIEYFLDVFLPHRMRSGNVFLMGISLGGSQVAHYLAKGQAHRSVKAAAMVSAPMDLRASADFMLTGINRLYVLKFRNSLLKKYELKKDIVKNDELAQNLARARTFWDLDNWATAPLHGFRDASHYYEEMSAKKCLHDNPVPALYLASRDDPFIPAASMPDGHGKLTVFLTSRGGHVGFIDNRGKSWMVSAVFKYFSAFESREQVIEQSVG